MKSVRDRSVAGYFRMGDVVVVSVVEDSVSVQTEFREFLFEQVERFESRFELWKAVLIVHDRRTDLFPEAFFGGSVVLFQ